MHFLVLNHTLLNASMVNGEIPGIINIKYLGGSNYSSVESIINTVNLIVFMNLLTQSKQSQPKYHWNVASLA